MFRSAAKLLIPAAALCALVAAACESHPDVEFADDDDATTPGVIAGAPLNVAAVAGTGSITLTWDEPATGDTPTSYRVMVATTAFEVWSSSLPGAYETTAGCCAFTGPFADEVRYWLGVAALNGAGEGPLSSIVSARPPGWEGFAVFDPGGGSSARVTGIAISGDGVFVSGSLQGTIGEASSNGIYDGFVSKLDRTGHRSWIRSFGGTDNEGAHGVAVDSGGNVVVVGYQVLGVSMEDYVVARYDGNGGQTFKKTLGVSGLVSDRANSVAVDQQWRIHVAGQTFGNLDGVTNGGGGDAYYVRFDPAGNRIFTRLIGSTSGDDASAIAVLPDGTTFVAGSTFGTLPSGSLPANSNAGGQDAFVTKFDSAGVFQWTKQFGSAGADRATAIAIDTNGEVYVAGAAGGNVGDGGLLGISDPFVGKFTSTGTQVWLHMLSAAGQDDGLGISVGTANVYVVGRSGSSIGSGTYDGFVAAYSLEGTIQWTKTIGSENGDEILAVQASPTGFYVGGSTNTQAVVDGIVGKYSSAGVQQ